jgi:hypothetical protein
MTCRSKGQVLHTYYGIGLLDLGGLFPVMTRPIGTAVDYFVHMHMKSIKQCYEGNCFKVDMVVSRIET